MKAMEEKDWEAENDARTMADADVIKNDPERYEKAVKAAQDMARDKKKEAESISRIAEGRTPSRRAKNDVDVGF